MGVMITGIAVRRFPSSGGSDAVVHVLRGIDEVKHEKFEQEG
ncbi:VSK-int, partial [Photobacterium ganghwense]